MVSGSVATSGSIFVIVDSVLLYGVSVRQRDNLLPQVVVLMQRDLSRSGVGKTLCKDSDMFCCNQVDFTFPMST